MKKALTAWEWLSQDEQTRALDDARQKGLMTYHSDMAGAREQGRQEGLQEGLLQAARNLLKTGLDPARVAALVDLPIDEVAELQRQMANNDPSS